MIRDVLSGFTGLRPQFQIYISRIIENSSTLVELLAV